MLERLRGIEGDWPFVGRSMGVAALSGAFTGGLWGSWRGRHLVRSMLLPALSLSLFTGSSLALREVWLAKRIDRPLWVGVVTTAWMGAAFGKALGKTEPVFNVRG